MHNKGDILRLLSNELAAVAEFTALLQQEQQALVTGVVEGFESLATAKLGIADRLNALSNAREQSLRRAGLPEGRQGMDAWLATQQASARSDWQSLLNTAAEARRLNELNGKLIAERLSNNQQALSILTAATNRAALYGPDGQTHVSGAGRKLGSA